MYYKDRVRNQGILERKPVIKLTNKSIEFHLELLSNGWEIGEILKNYPQLTKENVIAVGEYLTITYTSRGK
ncbi:MULTISPECIES: DUF433 domain-containing protein [Thermodesulfovibrio]|jgi:uncharacterized protein (DUF433 family)|uniref:DUF433 domain-containing protein n=1 Tax=Thermodesulfovibrio obliviosus TaxID=3118332 RepID=A0AAU8H2J3_9BACT